VFLTPFALGRLLASDKPRNPDPDCPVCSVYTTMAYVDFTRATLNDLVGEFVRLELGYGEKDISVSNDVGILYDPDETDNLTKKLSDLGQFFDHSNVFASIILIHADIHTGISQDCCLTIIDDDDEDPFVNVVLNIQEA